MAAMMFHFLFASGLDASGELDAQRHLMWKPCILPPVVKEIESLKPQATRR